MEVYLPDKFHFLCTVSKCYIFRVVSIISNTVFYVIINIHRSIHHSSCRLPIFVVLSSENSPHWLSLILLMCELFIIINK